MVYHTACITSFIKTGCSCRAYIGMSVSVLALMVASAGGAQADGVQSLDVITQADEQSGAVTVSVPDSLDQPYVFGAGPSDYAGLSKNDYDTLSKAQLITVQETKDAGAVYKSNVITAKTLTFDGGGAVTFGTTATDFSAQTLRAIHIKEGTLGADDSADGHIVSALPVYDSNGALQANVNMQIDQNGNLYIHNTYNTIYNSLNQLNGSGTVILPNYVDLDSNQLNMKGGAAINIYGSGSHFTGTMLGVGSTLDMSAEPAMNEAGASAPLSTSKVLVSSASFDFDHAQLLNIGTLEISAAGAPGSVKFVDRPVGNALLHNGTSATLGELLVAAGTDGYHSTGSQQIASKIVNGAIANLVIRDAGTTLQAAQIVVGQQRGVRLPSDTASSTIGLDYGVSKGELWLANGASATVSGGGINGGIYLGNSAGNGPDQRTEGGTSNDYAPEGEAHGMLHITGDQVGYDASGHVVDSGATGATTQLTVQNGGLWIGPVDGGKGSGDVMIEHGGQLNLDNSFAVLGGQNGAGTITIGQGGALTVVGMKPQGLVSANQGAGFNTQRQGMLKVADGGVLNIGTSSKAGVLKLYGDLNLTQGSTTVFYEGTTSEKGNKGTDYNSHIEVQGDVTLGGAIQIAGIAGQNQGKDGAVEEGIYHLIDYTGTVFGKQNAGPITTKSGQLFSYIYDATAKTVDAVAGRAGNTTPNNTGDDTNNSGTPVLIRPPSWAWGDATWTADGVADGTPNRLPAPPIFTGPGGQIRAEGRDGQPLQASKIDFQASGYTIYGDSLAAIAGNNGQNFLNINAQSEKSGTIASSIVDNNSLPTSLMKTGNGTLILQAANRYSGATVIAAGTLNVAQGASLSDNSHVSVVHGATLDDSGSVGNVTNNGTIIATGQMATLSNSGGEATLKGEGQSRSVYNTGTLNLTDNAHVTGTVEQNSGRLNLSGNASIGVLQTDGSKDLDHSAGLDRTDDKMGESRRTFVESQLKVTQDSQARALLDAVHDTITGHNESVLGDLQGVGNLFAVAENSTVTVGTLQGYGTGYLGKGSVLTLVGNHTAYGDALFGEGGIAVQGQNNVLTGTNYYSGGTKIAAGGTLTAGAQSLGTGSVGISGATDGLPAGSLTIDEEGASNFTNSLTGSGIFNKVGAGTVTLSSPADDSRFAGITNVQQGELAVNNTLGGTTNVAAGAVLSGSGSVNNLTLDPKAYFGVTLEGTKGVVTPLTLTGTENHLNGAQVAVTVHSLSDLTLGKQYQTTILRLADTAEASGSLAETPRILNTAFLKVSVLEAQDNRSWLLDYMRVVPFEAYAQTHNERQVAASLDRAAAAGASSSFMNALLSPSMQTGAQVRGAYNALSGEINASAKTAMVNDSFYIQEVVVDRLDCAGDALRAHAHDGKQQTSGYCDVDPTRHVSVWGTVYGQRGGQSGNNAGVAHMGQSSVGWIMGADTGLSGGWRVGGLLAYGRDWFSVQSGRSSSAHSNSATIGAYAGNAWHVGGLTDNAAITFKSGVSYSWNMLHTNRRLTYGDYSGRVSSNNRTGTGQAFVESGYRMVFESDTPSPLEVEPFARMTYVNYGQDSYREHGADAALRVKGQNSSIGFSTIGVKLATNVTIGKLIFSPHVEAGYRRAFGRTNARVREGFTSLAGGYGMAVQGTPLFVNTAQINTGFAAHLTDRIDVNIDYIGQYGGNQTSSGGSGSFRYKF